MSAAVMAAWIKSAEGQLMKFTTWAVILVVFSQNIGTSESLTVIPLGQIKDLDLLLSSLPAQTTDRRVHGRSLAPKSKYCQVTPDHTACRYTKRNQDGKCKRVRSRGLNAEEKKMIVDLHNELRAKVARGDESPQPSATNMNQLTWNDESAAIAQLWVDQCSRAHDAAQGLQGRVIRATVKGNPKSPEGNGQNGGWTIPDAEGEKNVIIRNLIEAWYAEVKKFDPSGVEADGPRPKGTGHYTLIVSAELDRIGCGYMHFDDEQGAERHSLFCNYAGGNGGNISNLDLYEVGPPCKACPNNCVQGALCSKRSARSLLFELLGVSK